MASHGATIVWPQSRQFLWLNGGWNVGWVAVAAIFVAQWRMECWMGRSRGHFYLWGLGEWGRINPIEFGKMILTESSLRASFSGGLGKAQPPATQEDSCGIIGGRRGKNWDGLLDGLVQWV